MKPIADPQNVCIRPCVEKDMGIVYRMDSQYMTTTASKTWLTTRREENPDLFYIAHYSEGGDAPVGYISGGVFVHPHTGKDAGYISRLVVLPDYRKIGVGTMLINALEFAFVRYRGYDSIFVGVRKTNPGAQEFYSKLGYIHVPEFDRPDGYADHHVTPDDRYMMIYSKPLYTTMDYPFNACVFVPTDLFKIVPVEKGRPLKKIPRRRNGVHRYQ
jgi:ribosomal protein S18 acetylase RimI-like enzyme